MRTNKEIVEVLQSLDAHECSLVCDWLAQEIKVGIKRKGRTDTERAMIARFISDTLQQALGL